jgi:Cysteine-rich secretory protein family
VPAITRLACIALLMAAAPASPQAVRDLDNVERDWLDAHNVARDDVGITPLKWSDNLARDAKSWARHLARANLYEHASPQERKGQGENLWRDSWVLVPVGNHRLLCRGTSPFPPRQFPRCLAHRALERCRTLHPDHLARNARSWLRGRPHCHGRSACVPVLACGQYLGPTDRPARACRAPLSRQPNCSATNLAKASARWLMACFSSGAISAKVSLRPVGTNTGS